MRKNLELLIEVRYSKWEKDHVILMLQSYILMFILIRTI